MPDYPPPLTYSKPTRGFATAHFWSLVACFAAAAALFAAVTGFLLLFIAQGSHHDGEDVIQLGRTLCIASIIISPLGFLIAILGLIRREPPLLAITSLLLNTLPAFGALAVCLQRY